MPKYMQCKEHYYNFKKIFLNYKQKILNQKQNQLSKIKFKKIYKMKGIKKTIYKNYFLKMKKSINNHLSQNYKKKKKKFKNNKIYVINYKRCKPKNVN